MLFNLRDGSIFLDFNEISAMSFHPEWIIALSDMTPPTSSIVHTYFKDNILPTCSPNERALLIPEERNWVFLAKSITPEIVKTAKLMLPSA